jgi:hypothetical protein
VLSYIYLKMDLVAMLQHFKIGPIELNSSCIRHITALLVSFLKYTFYRDYFGRKAKLFLTLVLGISALTLSSCGVVPSEPWVVLGRDDQGQQRTARSHEEGWDDRKSVLGDTDWLQNLLDGEENVGSGSSGSGIAVNSYLWRASLDTISFMPLTSADPFGGVIITDWHSPDKVGEERFKLNVYILGRALRADGLRVAVFRQVQDQAGIWRDAELPGQASTSIEDAILTRARRFRAETIVQ